MRYRADFFDVRGGAQSNFKSAGLSAPALLFFAMPQRKVAKRNGTPRLGLRFASTSLRSSAKTGAAELAHLRWAQTVLALIGFDLAVLGCAKG
ncbi:MAG: hypothetical protein WBM63_06950 [Sedimenticolaceae bacterium]